MRILEYNQGIRTDLLGPPGSWPDPGSQVHVQDCDLHLLLQAGLQGPGAVGHFRVEAGVAGRRDVATGARDFEVAELVDLGFCWESKGLGVVKFLVIK